MTLAVFVDLLSQLFADHREIYRLVVAAKIVDIKLVVTVHTGIHRVKDVLDLIAAVIRQTVHVKVTNDVCGSFYSRRTPSQRPAMTRVHDGWRANFLFVVSARTNIRHRHQNFVWSGLWIF